MDTIPVQQGDTKDGGISHGTFTHHWQGWSQCKERYAQCPSCILRYYRGFPSPCNAKRHVLYKHVRAQLFTNRFSVTKTHSQEFRHAYAYNLTATEHYCTGFTELRIRALH